MRKAGCLPHIGRCTAQRTASLPLLPSSLSGQCLVGTPTSLRATPVSASRRGDKYSPCCATAEAADEYDFPSPLLPRRRQQRTTKGVRWLASGVAATDVCEPISEAKSAGAAAGVGVSLSRRRGNSTEPQRTSVTEDATQPESSPGHSPLYSAWPPAYETASSSTSRDASSNTSSNISRSSSTSSTSRDASGDGPPSSDGPSSGDLSSDKAKYMWLQSRRYLYEDPPQKPIAEADRRATAGGCRVDQGGAVISPEEPPFETTFTVLAERLQLWRTADSAEGEWDAASPGRRGKPRRRRRVKGLAPTGLVDAGPPMAAAAQSHVANEHATKPPSQRSRSNRAGDPLPQELLSGTSLYPGAPATPARRGTGRAPKAGTEFELEIVNEMGSSESAFAFSSPPPLMRPGFSPAPGSPAYRELVLGEPQVRDALSLSISHKQRTTNGGPRAARAPVAPPSPPASSGSHVGASSPGGEAQGGKAPGHQRRAASEGFCTSQAVQDLLEVAALSFTPLPPAQTPLKRGNPPEEGAPLGSREEGKGKPRRRKRSGVRLSRAGYARGTPGGQALADSSAGFSPSALPEHSSAGAGDLGGEFGSYRDWDSDSGVSGSDSGGGSSAASAEEWRALGAEVRAFMARRGLPLRMPTRKELRADFDHGLPLEKWIQRAGGAYACAQCLGIPMPHTRRPKGYWQQAANLEQQVRDFQMEHGLPFSVLPSRAVMVQKGRYDLARALERWGGHNDVAQMLGLGVRQRRPKGLTLAGKRRGTKAWKDPEGVGAAEAAAAQAPGGEAKEVEGGAGGGSEGAKERGKGAGGAGAKMPVKACLPSTTKKWFTLSPSLEAPLPGEEAELKSELKSELRSEPKAEPKLQLKSELKSELKASGGS